MSGLLNLWLEQAPQRIGPLYPWLSAGHILALGSLIGSITVLDLRLLGLFRRLPLDATAAALTRVGGFGLAAAILTGLLLFSVQPAHYLGNPAFVLKLALIGAGLVNIAILHRQRGWRRLHRGGSISLGVRLSAIVSLLLWISTIFAGRWIAFV